MAIERELKFRLSPRAAARAAERLALGAPQSLSSVYFDTADQALRRAHIALRLRRHGRQWLQTLKSELAPGARGEWETPAPRGLDVARLPLAQIKRSTGVDVAALAGRLRPQFETRFKRRIATILFDGAIIEAALDRGQVVAARSAAPLCELELELKSGAPQLLARYAKSLIEPLELQLSLESKAERGYRLAQGERLAAPRKWRAPELPPGATSGEALARLVGAALEQAGANAHGMLGSEDAEYLHQLRVALRRLRATLAAFKALEPRAKPLKRRLRALTPALGIARDWDVFVRSLPRESALALHARTRQAHARRTARVLLAGPVFNGFLVRALQWIEQRPWTPGAGTLATFASRALERLHRKALELGRRIDWQAPHERHALRIRVKRLRYACDAFTASFPGARAATYLAALRALQDRFGELNDIRVGRRLAAELGGDAALERRFASRERRLTRGLQRDWRSFAARAPFWQARS